MKKLLLFTVVFMCNASYAQGFENYKSALLVNINSGYELPIRKFMQGMPVDGHVGYKDNLWGAGIAPYFFIKKRWGVFADFILYPSSGSKEAEKNADDYVYDFYAGNYFMDDYYSFWASFESPAAIRFLAGPVYRWENERFLFYAGLGFGVTNFPTKSYGFKLKQKNSNLNYSVINLNEHSVSPFTIAPTFTAGYKINKRLSGILNIKAPWFKADFKDELYRFNHYTKQHVTDETFYFKRSSLQLNINAGLMLVMANKRKL